MTKYRLLLLLLLLPIFQVLAQSYEGYTIEKIQAINKKWNLDNWDDGGEISHYIHLNMSEFWTQTTIRKAGVTKKLKEDYQEEIAETQIRINGDEMTLRHYINQSTKVDGMIILQGNRIVYEAYPRMLPNDRHLYWSVSKVFASTLISILEDRNQLDVSKPIGLYLPELKGTGWENVSVIDILDMASGIDCREWVDGAFDNPETCYYQFEASLGFLKRTKETASNAFEHILNITSAKSSGEIFEYTSANTFVLSCLIEKITGQTYAENIEREIWQKIGAESDALIAQTDGTAISHAGISSTLRDLARFGYMFLKEEKSVDHNFVSNEYIDKIQKHGRPHLVKAFGEENYKFDQEIVKHNTYQWDKVMEDGDFYKGGFSGQGLYISPSRNLVIAFFGTSDENGVSNKLDEISRQISKSKIFNK